MSRYGWAYVNGIPTGSSTAANGPTGSIQFHSASQNLSGTSNFTYDTATNKVTLLGQLTGSSLVISASVVSASTYLGITGSGGGTPGGANKQIQFNSGSTFSGSQNLTYDYSTGRMTLTGTMVVSGTLYANEYYTNIISSSIIYSSGSTKFGDDAADTHQFTGSILGDVVSGTIARFTTITGSNITGTFAGNGTGLTSLTASNITNFTNDVRGQFSAGTGIAINTGIISASNVPNSSLQNSAIALGTTAISLGATGSIVQGVTTLSSSNVTGTTAQFTTLSASYISASYIDFDTNLAAAPTFRTGRLFYNPDTGDLAYDTSITDVVLNIGQQTFVKVKNSSGAQINKGKLVFISGGVGDNPLIYTASWNTDTTSARTIGMVMRNIANGDNGYVILNGVITGVDTAAYLGGTTLFLSSSGDYTSTRPTQPLHGVRIGEVVRSHATVGSIFINIQNGFELDELHDVLVSSASNGDLLVYDSGTSLWKNTKALSGSYTITSALTASSISASNALLTNITASSISSSGTNSVFSFATFNNIAVTAGAVNATIGATTPSTGKFTTLSASSTLQVAGAITGTGGMNISGGTTTLGSNLTVNGGQTTVQSLTASAGISSSAGLVIGGNARVLGNVTFDSNLVVSGNTTLGDASSDIVTAAGQLTSSGGIVLQNAPFSFSYLNVTSNHTMTTASCIIGVSASAPLTITLPSASATTSGRYFIVKDEAGNSATNNITISCSVGSGDTIDNLSSSVINVNKGSYTIYRGGANKYYIV